MPAKICSSVAGRSAFLPLPAMPAFPAVSAFPALSAVCAYPYWQIKPKRLL
jgi:hypothetical protein